MEGNEDIKPMVLINPDIKFYSEEKVFIEEGCLSIPEVRADVERPRLIKITYLDSDLQKHTVEADGILARVMQHEYDHLQGILFTDRIPDEVKKELKKDLNKIRKREIEIDYPVTEDTDYQLK
jgi:peptide deformylase